MARSRRPPHWFLLGLLGLVAVAALMVGIGIGSKPFWLDEVASVSVAERSFGGILDVLGDTDSNMGLYYLLLHAWLWGGDSEGWVASAFRARRDCHDSGYGTPSAPSVRRRRRAGGRLAAGRQYVRGPLRTGGPRLCAGPPSDHGGDVAVRRGRSGRPLHLPLRVRLRFCVGGVRESAVRTCVGRPHRLAPPPPAGSTPRSPAGPDLRRGAARGGASCRASAG